MDLSEAARTLSEAHPWVAMAILFASAAIEYVFPPFPGDTVTLAGAALVTAGDFPFAGAFAAVLAGGLVGSAIDFALGRALARGAHGRLGRMGIARQAATGLDRVAHAFARHGEAYIAINRFLPGIRAFLFVAAGMAGLRFGRVMLFATISGAAWNLLIMAAGMAVGANLDSLQTMVREYTLVIWVLLAVVAAGAGVRYLRRRRASGDRAGTPPGAGGPDPR